MDLLVMRTVNRETCRSVRVLLCVCVCVAVYVWGLSTSVAKQEDITLDECKEKGSARPEADNAQTSHRQDRNKRR